jgi:hypothetical protein
MWERRGALVEENIVCHKALQYLQGITTGFYTLWQYAGVEYVVSAAL